MLLENVKKNFKNYNTLTKNKTTYVTLKLSNQLIYHLMYGKHYMINSSLEIYLRISYDKM